MFTLQQDLFDQSFDVPLSHVASTTQPQKRRRPTKATASKKGGSQKQNEQDLSTLLPWLFPEDYPELTNAIDQTIFTWSDDDIYKLCEGVIRSSIMHLTNAMNKNNVRDEAVEWLFNERSTPFSLKHCCMELEVNYFRMRESILDRMLNARRTLEQCRRNGTITIRESTFNQWLGEQGWLYELESMGESRGIQDTNYDAIETWCHYERETQKTTTMLSWR
jgi:hypothetical protein